jgi:D-alanine-D-alanine ligase
MKHVCVLKGGLSSEREVSLNTAAAVVKALKEAGYTVSELDVGATLVEDLRRLKPDVVFNALHGTFGEDGCVQVLLEMLQIPYTHSGVLASAIGMDKPMAKVIFEAAGIRCTVGKVMKRADILKNPKSLPKLPLVIKPTADGSSVGVLILTEQKDVEDISELTLPNHEELLVETYVPGKELTVGVLDGKALGVIEIRPKEGFYTYKNKYTSGMTEYLAPAPIHAKVTEEVMLMAELAHKALGCRGVSRSDFRYDDTKGEPGVAYLMEINTHPGMTATSLVPKLAAEAGIPFPQLMDRLVQLAQLDHKL